MLLWVGKPAAAAPKPAVSREDSLSAGLQLPVQRPEHAETGGRRKTNEMREPLTLQPRMSQPLQKFQRQRQLQLCLQLLGLSQGAHQAKGTKRTEFSRLSAPQRQSFRAFPTASALQREGGSAGTARPCWRSSLEGPEPGGAGEVSSPHQGCTSTSVNRSPGTGSKQWFRL